MNKVQCLKAAKKFLSRTNIVWHCPPDKEVFICYALTLVSYYSMEPDKECGDTNQNCLELQEEIAAMIRPAVSLEKWLLMKGIEVTHDLRVAMQDYRKAFIDELIKRHSK